MKSGFEFPLKLVVYH